MKELEARITYADGSGARADSYPHLCRLIESAARSNIQITRIEVLTDRRKPIQICATDASGHAESLFALCDDGTI